MVGDIEEGVTNEFKKASLLMRRNPLAEAGSGNGEEPFIDVGAGEVTES